VPSRFEIDTQLRPVAPGHFLGRIDRGWWVQRGPNGGYVAALLLRAATSLVADPVRRPRSFTAHYLEPPAEGPVEVRAVVERAGRGLSTVSVRMIQGEKTVALATVALSVSRPGPSFAEQARPEVPPPDRVPVGAGPTPIPMGQRFQTRPVLGEPFAGAARAITGGWIRLQDPAPIDEHLVVALCDAWPPAVFSRLETLAAVPTIDLTVHFRNNPDGLQADDHCFVRFRTRFLAEGFLEEDGEVWSPDGRLLALSRQLAAFFPAPDAAEGGERRP